MGIIEQSNSLYSLPARVTSKGNNKKTILVNVAEVRPYYTTGSPRTKSKKMLRDGRRLAEASQADEKPPNKRPKYLYTGAQKINTSISHQQPTGTQKSDRRNTGHQPVEMG